MEAVMQSKGVSYTPILVVLLFLVVAILLGGCSSVPKQEAGAVPVAEPAQVTGERIAYGYAANAQVRQSAAALVKSKQISPDQGRRVLSLTDLVRTGLDIASKYYFDGQLNEADRALTRANELLSEANKQTENSRQGGK